jgi:hypothetical protein
VLDVHAANGAQTDPNFVAIGNPDLIGKRNHRVVPLTPGGTLANYVPFYFTPKSPMLLNIKTGYGGIIKRGNDEIVVLVSSCQALSNHRVQILFTDRHAYKATADWSGNPDDLATMIDWKILCRHNFARDDSYPDKMERYQAEALAYRHVPSAALLGVGCASAAVKARVDAQVQVAGLSLKAVVQPHWYF